MDPAHRSMMTDALAAQGRCVVTVHGRSMAPLIRDGDRITIVPLHGTPVFGTVVALFAADQLIVHRVVALVRSPAEPAVIVAGDSSPGSRARIPASELLGIVESVSRGAITVQAWLRPPWCFLGVYAGYLLRFLMQLKEKASPAGPTGRNR
jgi:hypothetical protein